MSNSNYLSVSTLTKYLKRKFDADPHLQKVLVMGEVSNYRPGNQRHLYFSLKDEGAVISAALFNYASRNLPFELEEGMKVLVTGRVSLYEPRGSYQLYVDNIQPDGIGALYLALEQLKKKYYELGYIDRPKKPLPKYPKKIAVITSPTGSVIQDILTTLERRYPIVDVTVFPTRVQGKEATAEIVQAFNEVERRYQQYDLIILARGGGSIEDLWCFNEEPVAEAIMRSSIPVISSVGHETDMTIADLIADLRMPTPTAAAEVSVPELTSVQREILQNQERLLYTMRQRLELHRKQLERLETSYVLAQPRRLYEPYLQQLDHLTTSLNHQTQLYFNQLNQRLTQWTNRMNPQHITNQTLRYANGLNQLEGQLLHSWDKYFEHKKQTFSYYTGVLDAYSPLQTLKRGYSIAQKDDQIITTIHQVKPKDQLTIQLKDGYLTTQVQEVNEKETEE
ncbi:exodeoxyribonuclease VII large subunit [Dolosicoccus paucivorans]